MSNVLTTTLIVLASAVHTTGEGNHCQPLKVPNGGSGIFCTNNNNEKSHCIVDCNDGFYPPRRQIAVCNSDQTWTDGNLECERQQCQKAVAPKNVAGLNCSEDSLTGSVCTPLCDATKGFYDSGKQSTKCMNNLIWSNPNLACDDRQAPKFTSCMPGVTTFVDRSSWQEPTAEDNSGSVNVNQVGGPLPNSKLQSPGSYSIRYDAVDPSGNKAVEQCTFNLVYRTFSYP